jgi:predicted AlkP superfamily pyrophosphatase or phosphodiesterase
MFMALVIVGSGSAGLSPPSSSTGILNRIEMVVPTVVTQSEVEHVVIMTIDGLRPDALEMADTPTLDELRAKGAYSPSAITVDPSITLVSHASMLTGRTKESHGLLWNSPYIGWPGLAGPTLFSIAHDAGLSTGMVFGKEKLNYLVLPNSVDKLHGTDCHDPEVKDRAIEVIEAGLPDVFFVHFPDTDRVGHDYGWLSANQLYAVTFADNMVGEVVAALEREGYLTSTLLIITSDHGGHLKTHGNDTPEDMTIPWLAVGPNVPPGLILNRQIETYDTAATALMALDLPLPEDVVGQPIREVLK